MDDLTIARKYISKAQKARNSGIEFNLSFVSFRNLMVAKKCKYTGIGLTETCADRPASGSDRTIDRIDNSLGYIAGNVVIMFYPMAVEYEIATASPKNPFLVAGVIIDLGRIADVLLRIDRLEGGAPKPVTSDPSGIFEIYLNDNILNPFIRVFV